jgi:hypothetical protein
VDLGHWLDLYPRPGNHSLVNDHICPKMHVVDSRGIGMKSYCHIAPHSPRITYVCYLRIDIS